MDDTETIIANVIWKSDVSLNCLVRCDENVGILIPNPENPVKIGDFVSIEFSKEDYDKYFSGNQTNIFPNFEGRHYKVLPEIYRTTAELVENQGVIEHDFFGIIHNQKNLRLTTGTGIIKIKRNESNNGEQWELESIESVQEKYTKIVGIVVSHHMGTTYVWCKERPVGFDVTLKNSSDDLLPVGTWISFSVENDVFKEAFSAVSPSGNVPRYEIENFVILDDPIYETCLTGKNLTTINLKLECGINESSSIHDIFHPFVGLIINERFTFEISGIYTITIIRAKKANDTPKSVWILRSRELTSVDEPAHKAAPQRSSQPVVQFQESEPNSMLSSSTRSTNQPSSPSTQERPSRPVHQTRASDFLQQETSPIPAPQRLRSRSRPNRSASRPRESLVEKAAIIYKIMKYELKEVIHVWLLDDHKQGRLKLDMSAENKRLELGDVFTAAFARDGDIWISNRPENLKLNFDHAYERRGDVQHGIEIRVYADTLKNAGAAGNKYPTIYHHHFGNIIDNFGKLQNHDRIKYHMWIRNVKVDDKFQWVVIEQII